MEDGDQSGSAPGDPPPSLLSRTMGIMSSKSPLSNLSGMRSMQFLCSSKAIQGLHPKGARLLKPHAIPLPTGVEHAPPPANKW